MNAIQLRQNRDQLYNDMVAFHSERADKAWPDEDKAKWQQWKDDIGILDDSIMRMEEIPAPPTQPVQDRGTSFTPGDTTANSNREGPFKTEQQQAPAPGEGDTQWDDELRGAQARLEFREWLSQGTVRGRYVPRYYIGGAMRSLRNESDPDFKLAAQVRKLAEGGDELAQRFLRSETRAAGDVLIGTDTSGGHSVPDEAMANVVYAMKRYNGILQAGPTIITTDSGANLPVPTINDTANKAIIVGEDTEAPRVNIPFGQITLSAYRYSTRGIFLSLEFLQDTSLDVESMLSRVIGERLGRAHAEHYTDGTGVGQPQGLVNGATVYQTLANSVTDPTFAHIVGMMTSIDGAYQAGAGYMFNQDTLGKVMQITGISGQPIWFPSTAPGVPPNLLGRPYYINDEMDSFGAGNTPMLYGDYSTFWVRNVSGLEIHRMNEKEIEAGMVGIVGFARSDAKMINAGTNPIKKLVIAA